MAESGPKRGRKTLAAEDRALFSLAARAVACNPFGDTRADVDRKLAGTEAHGDRDAVLRHGLERVTARLDALRDSGQPALKRFRDADREVLESAVLFALFHNVLPLVDRFIVDTLDGASAVRRAGFADDLLQGLAAWGIAPETAARYTARFYQLRRAFYFIAKALHGDAPCIRTLRCELWNNIFTHDIRLYDRYLWDRMEDFSTLLLGETGTGKGTAALAIGRSGMIPYDPQRGGFTEGFLDALVGLNLSQFPETLIESELFGHRKGAFTGAVDHHQGLLSRCRSHGAIFLDEIGEVSAPIQIKLLQVLQERVYSPVGSHETHRFAGRVIAATNRSPAELRGAGRFRDDFYYRLCSDVITVPTLRARLAEHPDELAGLVEHILERMGGDVLRELGPRVVEALHASPGPRYAWPGNVRELEQAVRRILLKGAYEGDARPAVDAESALAQAVRTGELNARDLLARYAVLLYAREGSYGAVARRLGLDWRTVKKYVDA